MLFSCKISSAVLSFWDLKGEDLSPLLESTALPEEFLRDPSYWMKAPDMEAFLSSAQSLSHEPLQDLFQKIGHAGPELRSWGVLDSVLRMMPNPHEILAQPQRFLSYFISPEPPIEGLVKTNNSVEFVLPVSSDIYPLVTSYLKAAFESLPLYSGQPLAQCSWTDVTLKLSWGQEQPMIFANDPGRQISPELLRSVVQSLEKHQKELEEKNRELQANNDQLNDQLRKKHLEFEAQLAASGMDLSALFQQPEKHLRILEDQSIETLKDNLARLSDYMVRAQQLITLLIGQDRLNNSIKAAIKRTDWELVKKQFPQTVLESRDLLEKANRHTHHTKENQNV